VNPSFSFELPTHRVGYEHEFVTGEAVAQLCEAAERAGFSGVHVTDHPAPDAKWLDSGGHHALDPFVALSFAAAATTRAKLITNIYVAAYRNPFLGAKAVQSLDVLSGGRLILGTAAGYLKPEFAALGVDFDRRGEIFDENLDVMCRVLTGEDTAYEGVNYKARGVRLRPLPVSRPRPPIWIGGNSKAAISRAVAYDGWAPFTTGRFAKSSRTAPIDAVADLVAGIAYARTLADEMGRTGPLDVFFSGGPLINESLAPGERRSNLDRLVEAGVTWFAISIPGDRRSEVVDGIQSFAGEFIHR
jgi:probable F420-dependent oxidoreductase